MTEVSKKEIQKACTREINAAHGRYSDEGFLNAIFKPTVIMTLFAIEEHLRNIRNLDWVNQRMQMRDKQ
jgi:hypothetical protein